MTVGWWREGGNKPASLITSAVQYFTYDVPIGRQYGVRSISVARPATCKFRTAISFFRLYLFAFFSSSFPYARRTAVRPPDTVAATFMVHYTPFTNTTVRIILNIETSHYYYGLR